MQFLITLEETEAGFSVQVPDLAILTYGKTIELAKQSAIVAIEANLNTYTILDQAIPSAKSITEHLNDTDFKDLLFGFVNVKLVVEKKAA